MKKSLFFAAFAVLAASGPAGAQERFTLTGERAAIYNLAGEIRVEAGSGREVTVEVTRGGADSGRLEFERTQDAGWQQLIVKYPSNRIVYRRLGRLSRSEFAVREDGTFGKRNLDPQLGTERITRDQGSQRGGERTRVSGSGSGLEAHADLRILVPAGRAIAVHLGVGKVIVSNVDGDLQIDTRSGAIEANGVRGFARFDTGSGSIALRNGKGNFGAHTGSGGVQLHDVEGDAVAVETGSGSIDASNVSAKEIALETGSGGITIVGVDAANSRISTGSGGVRAQRFGSNNFDIHTGSGSVRAELARDVQSGRIDTGSGGVQIGIPRDLGADITIDTGSGGIDFNAPGLSVSEKRKNFLRGHVGDGNGVLRVSTGSGGVSFRSN
jgi:lia operon protein LiaG